MFQKPYEGVVHFGHWAVEHSGRYARRDALAILADALDRCRDEDMRTPDVIAALDYLQPQAVRQWPFASLRRALDMTNPEGRWQNANAPFNGIRKAFDQ